MKRISIFNAICTGMPTFKAIFKLLECVDRIAKDATENQIEEILLELDRKWRKFAENLIYLNRGGRDEFIKIARERAFKAIKVEA